MAIINTTLNVFGFTNSCTLHFEGKDYNEFVGLSNKISMVAMFGETLTPKEAYKFMLLLGAKSHYTKGNIKTWTKQTYNYFKAQKEFDFSLDECGKNQKKQADRDEQFYGVTANSSLLKNIEYLFEVVNRDPNLNVKKAIIKSLLYHIKHLNFPNYYSFNKKKIIVGYIASKLGLLKTVEEYNDADYNKYLEDRVKYYSKVAK